jgi:thioester reductase-like protein
LDPSLLDKPPAGGGYQQSKWVAERLVHKAALRGLQATVCRPGTIGPHSVTGACNVTDYATCFILSIAQNGIYLDSNNEFELNFRGRCRRRCHASDEHSRQLSSSNFK